MDIRKALITAAGKNQRTLPLQALVDRDGVTKTALAIIISCLGLYGLVSLLTLRRAKEIAVRKVLGASVRHLLVLLSAGQLQLIGLAAAFHEHSMNFRP